MKAKIHFISLIAALSILAFSGCKKETVQGPPGQNANVYYSEWFTPSAWFGTSGDWYFSVTAPDLKANVVDDGIVLAYVWLADDIYANAVRPLPAYAVGANWEYLIPDYESIEFTCDMVEQPRTTGNRFRFVAIPGTEPALKSLTFKDKSEQELRSMSYKDVCRLLNIPE